MKNEICIIKHNLVKQMRRYSFLVVIVIAIFLSVMCVPAQSASYEIFYMGGVRGTYNSAWLGGLAALLSTILLWLPGFYLLRSQISEDRELKLGQILSAAPCSKLKYIGTKTISNFVVLLSLQLIFLLSFVAMQFIRGESYLLDISGYLLPFICLTVPALLIDAVLTIVFDVIPFLRGVFGNVVIFFIWMTGTSLSVAMPNNQYDLFGIGYVLNNMIEGAKEFDSNIFVDGASFGYYPRNDFIPTFLFKGISYQKELLLARLVWFVIAILLMLLAVIVFDRFRKNEMPSMKNHNVIKDKQPISVKASVYNEKNRVASTIELSPVKRINKPALLRMVIGEMKILLPHSIGWYLVAIAAMVACIFLSDHIVLKFAGYILILPIMIWSNMGCHEKIYQTENIIFSSCSPRYKRGVTLLAGIVITMILSMPIIFRFAIIGEVQSIFLWLIGIVFISALALLLGIMSGKRRFFEAVYIVWFYLGQVNGIKSFDFVGTAGNLSLFYGIAAVVIIGFVMIFLTGREIKL